MTPDASERELEVAGLLPLDERPGPASRITAARASDMVAEAIRSWDASSGSVVPIGSTRRRRWGVVATAAVVVLAGSAAAYFARSNEPTTQPTSQPAPPLVAPPEPPSSDPKPADRAEEEPPPAAAPEHARAAAPAAPRQTASREAPRSAAEVAEDWLQQANALRSRGEWSAAERAYGKVIGAYPSSGAAYVARVSAATIRLDHLGDPDGARRLFQSAHRGNPGGALDLEVQRGIAASSRRLGDVGTEKAALRAIVTAHGSSRAAEQARARLEAIGE